LIKFKNKARSFFAFTFAFLALWLLPLALRLHVLLKRLKLPTTQVLSQHTLLLINPQFRLFEIPNDDIVIERARMQLVVTEGHLGHSVVMALQIFEAFLSWNIPNSDRAFVRCREQPLVLYGAILFVDDVRSHVEHPASMALEQFDLACRQIIGSNHGINTRNKQPFVPQMQAIDSFPRCYETTINFAGLYVDGSDNLVPRACKKQVMLLVDHRDIHGILKLVDSRASVRLNIPLTHCAIL